MNRFALALAALAAGAAQAETSPWYVGVAQAFTHDSNLYRVADGAPATGSTISTTTLLGGLDQPIGRQRLFGNASLQANRYSGNGSLNNNGYAVKLGLDWSTAERVSGTISMNLNRTLARFAPGDAPTTTVRNLERANVYDGLVRVGVVTPLTLEAGLTRRTLDYTASEFNPRDYHSDSLRVGARYRLGGEVVLGGGLRHTRSTYPQFAEPTPGSFAEDKVRRNDIDLNLTWLASGASTVNARLSSTRTRHSLAATQDLSGVTGAVSWAWRPTGKVSLNTDLVRDTGTETYFYALGLTPSGPVLGQGDNSRVTTRLALRGTWEATGKINVTAGLAQAQRSLRNNALVPVADSDRTLTASLGATWAPARSLLFGCDLYHERRSGGGALSLPYGVNTFGCSAQFVLQ